jgi:TonB family protein
MSKVLLISSLTAACWMAVAAPQAVDAPGVSVALDGASVLHRSPVGYPTEALQAGVQGTVSLQLKLDPAGSVSDAQVLSGPEELRKATLQSVLQWHFAQELGGTTRSVQIAFELPQKGPAAPTLPRVVVMQPGTVRSIQVLGLSEQARADLLSRLPLHEGDQWNDESAGKASAMVGEFDQHLTIRPSSITQSASGATEVGLTISAQVQRIRVGGNVQSAMALRKVPPVYPADAKAAGIQGVVHLAVIIGMDGTMQEVHSLSGPPELIQASMDAVKQWVYKPTLLNGNPVQVETTIDINYTLGN